MTHSSKALLTAVLAISSVLTTSDAEAGCHGRRGGRRGFSYGYSSFRNNHYSGGYGYSVSRPTQRVIRVVQPVETQPISSNIVPQTVPQQPVVPEQQFGTQQPTPPPTMGPQQELTQPQTAPMQPNQTAQQSALQALGGFAPPQAAPGPAPTSAPAYVGNWKATLGNGASVTLVMDQDGNFSWNATNKEGESSSFSGRYTVGSGSLTLIRSNDNQQLVGNMSNTTQNGFSFQVAGTNAAAINFSRS